jgi:hypothetical protein
VDPAEGFGAGGNGLLSASVPGWASAERERLASVGLGPLPLLCALTSSCGLAGELPFIAPPPQPVMSVPTKHHQSHTRFVILIAGLLLRKTRQTPWPYSSSACEGNKC